MMQSDVYFVGSTFLNFSQICPSNSPGLLNALVPGTPNCKIWPNASWDGMYADGCPFQMYSISGAINITKEGGYSFCTTSSEGYIERLLFFDTSIFFDDDNLAFLQIKSVHRWNQSR